MLSSNLMDAKLLLWYGSLAKVIEESDPMWIRLRESEQNQLFYDYCGRYDPLTESQPKSCRRVSLERCIHTC